MSKYNDTPRIDKLMEEMGYHKAQWAPVFWKEAPPEYKGNHKFFIGFPIPYSNYSHIEHWLDKEGIDENKMKSVLESSTIGWARHFSSKVDDEILQMLSADFYWHEADLEKHKRMVSLYEKTSGKKYK